MNFEQGAIPKIKKEETIQSPDILSEKRYEAWATALEKILKEVYSFQIPEETVENWRKLAVLMHQVDKIIDSKNEKERTEIIEILLLSLQNTFEHTEHTKDIESQIALFTEIRASLPAENKEYFERLIKMLLQVAAVLKVKTDINEVKKLTLIEGQITSKIFISLLPAEFREKERYKEMTMLLSRIGRIGNAFDTAIDLPQDFMNEQIKITPNIFHRASFLGAALSQGIGMEKKGILSVKTLKLFLHGVRAVIKDKEKEL